jgi:hypothetical protein
VSRQNAMCTRTHDRSIVMSGHVPTGPGTPRGAHSGREQAGHVAPPTQQPVHRPHGAQRPDEVAGAGVATNPEQSPRGVGQHGQHVVGEAHDTRPTALDWAAVPTSPPTGCSRCACTGVDVATSTASPPTTPRLRRRRVHRRAGPPGQGAAASTPARSGPTRAWHDDVLRGGGAHNLQARSAHPPAQRGHEVLDPTVGQARDADPRAGGRRPRAAMTALQAAATTARCSKAAGARHRRERRRRLVHLAYRQSARRCGHRRRESREAPPRSPARRRSRPRPHHPRTARAPLRRRLDVGWNTAVSRLRTALTRTGTLVIVGGETGGRLLGGLQRQFVAATLLSPLCGSGSTRSSAKKAPRTSRSSRISSAQVG